MPLPEGRDGSGWAWWASCRRYGRRAHSGSGGRSHGRHPRGRDSGNPEFLATGAGRHHGKHCGKPQSARSLTRDIRTFWQTASAAGVAAGAFGFLGGGLTGVYEVKAKLSLSLLLNDGLGIGLSAGLIVGLVFGICHSAAPSFQLSRIWLSLRGMLPWRFMDFLADAHQRGVLRVSGPVYQFRHVELQRSLARAGDTDEIVGRSPGPAGAE